VLTLAIAIIQNADLIALRTYAPAEDVGLYAAAAALGNAAVGLAAALYLPFYPRVVEASARSEPTRPYLRALILQLCAAGALAILISIPLGSWIVGLLFGQALADAGALLPAYMAKVTALLTMFVVGQYVLATGRHLSIAACLGPALLAVVILVFAQPPPAWAAYVGLGAGLVGTLWLGWLSRR
jgi:O-antigen/teichoic acid export membrane protein